MLQRAVLILSAVAIAANLLLPERFIKYPPCCLDEHGNYVPSRCFPEEQGGLVNFSIPHHCCKVKIVSITTISNISFEAAGSDVAIGDAWTPKPPMAFVPALQNAVAPDSIWSSRAPPDISLFTLHARLNT